MLIDANKFEVPEKIFELYAEIKSAFDKRVQELIDKKEIKQRSDLDLTIICIDTLHFWLKSIMDSCYISFRGGLKCSKVNLIEAREYYDNREKIGELIDSGIDCVKFKITKNISSVCIRCRYRHESVGSIAEHPEICNWCLDQIS